MDQILNDVPEGEITNEELLEIIREREEAHRLYPRPTYSWESIEEALRINQRIA